MHPPERWKRTLFSQERDAGKCGNLIPKSQPFMLGWGILFPVSTFVFSCVISKFTRDMQILASYTNALLGCTKAFSIAPKWYSMKHPILFFYCSWSLLLQRGRSTLKDVLIHAPYCRAAVLVSVTITDVPSDGSCWDATLKIICIIKQNRVEYWMPTYKLQDQ